jgi:hypothetical protein
VKEGVRWGGEEGKVERGEGEGEYNWHSSRYMKSESKKFWLASPHPSIVPMCCIVGYNNLYFFVKMKPPRPEMDVK